MKKVLYITWMAILIVGPILLLSFTDMDYHTKACKSFKVDVLNPSDAAMINSEEISELVADKFGRIEGSSLSVLHLYDLENTVAANPYVSSCEVFETMGGNVVLKARVREPLVRVINSEDDQYYLDMTGCLMPVSYAHPSHVIIASGFISDKFISIDKSEQSLNIFPASSVLHMIFPVAYYISKDSFLKSFIDQIYITEKKEIELVPKIGSQIIYFGDATDAKEKLENLKTFYRKVMANIDWNTYKSINLKYKNQVVCLKYIEHEHEQD
jgi:cell division protein FtsQ